MFVDQTLILITDKLKKMVNFLKFSFRSIKKQPKIKIFGDDLIQTMVLVKEITFMFLIYLEYISCLKILKLKQ